MALQRFSLFLTPCADDFAMLQRLIGNLSRQCGAVPFEPHVTVYSAGYDDEEAVAAAAAVASEGMTPLSLPVRGIGHGPEYFKSVFIEFDGTAPMHALRNRLAQRLGSDSGYRLDPHLSLLYHDLAIEEKGRVAAAVRLDRPALLFDRVKIVTPVDPEKGWRDVAGWRTVWSGLLTGGMPCEP